MAIVRSGYLLYCPDRHNQAGVYFERIAGGPLTAVCSDGDARTVVSVPGSTTTTRTMVASRPWATSSRRGRGLRLRRRALRSPRPDDSSRTWPRWQGERSATWTWPSRPTGDAGVALAYRPDMQSPMVARRLAADPTEF